MLVPSPLVVLLPTHVQWYSFQIDMQLGSWVYIVGFFQLFLIIIIARIFLRSERRIVGLKLEGGPCYFLVVVMVLVCPFSFLLDRLLFFAVSLRICLIISANSSGAPYPRCSALISSIPGLLLYFIFFCAFFTSSVVN